MRPVLVFPSLLLLAACREAPKRTEASTRPPVVVQTAVAAVVERPEIYEATGTVRARTTASLSSRVMAYVRQVSVQAGDRVKQGQSLVMLEARDLETGVRRADAARAEIEGAIPEAESGIAASRAQLELAQATFRRIDELARKRSVSSQEFDEAAARLKAAQAAYEVARARRTQLDAKLAQVEQERSAAAIVRGYAQIDAPFAGVVTARSVEPGNLAAPGAPLLTIEREGAYRLEAAVEESKLAAVRPGQSVEVALEALGRTFPARVSEVAPAVDASSRAYAVKIDLPPLAQVRSGMFGRAQFRLGKKKVLTVPPGAVMERGQLQSVFVVEDGAAHARLLTIGARGEVLSGLAAGEKVVTPVPADLDDGVKVEVRP